MEGKKQWIRLGLKGKWVNILGNLRNPKHWKGITFPSIWYGSYVAFLWQNYMRWTKHRNVIFQSPYYHDNVLYLEPNTTIFTYFHWYPKKTSRPTRKPFINHWCLNSKSYHSKEMALSILITPSLQLLEKYSNQIHYCKFEWYKQY